MNRRESLTAMLLASLGGPLLLESCKPDTGQVKPLKEEKDEGYGRTAQEKERDSKLLEANFFTEHEIKTIATLCDWILPASTTAGSATDAGVPEFIEFISKDLPVHQRPLRGGIMWLDNFSNKQNQKQFINCSEIQQKSILEAIAYPANAIPEHEHGVLFFSLMRNLTLTGYYTTRMGLDDLGYQGNTPNVWDGVPDEVLREHGLSYDKEWLSKCIDQSKRDQVARWDPDGNLIG